jgi:hypothetical protein
MGWNLERERDLLSWHREAQACQGPSPSPGERFIGLKFVTSLSATVLLGTEEKHC